MKQKTAMEMNMHVREHVDLVIEFGKGGKQSLVAKERLSDGHMVG